MFSGFAHDTLRRCLAPGRGSPVWPALEDRSPRPDLVDYLRALGACAYHPADALVDGRVRQARAEGVPVQRVHGQRPGPATGAVRLGVRGVFTGPIRFEPKGRPQSRRLRADRLQARGFSVVSGESVDASGEMGHNSANSACNDYSTRRKGMKRNGLFVRLVRSAGLFALALAIAPAARSEVIKIGAILAETGPAAFLGGPASRSLRMLADEINAAGGIKPCPSS